MMRFVTSSWLSLDRFVTKEVTPVCAEQLCCVLPDSFYARAALIGLCREMTEANDNFKIPNSC
jgi:hypothetical protein